MLETERLQIKKYTINDAPFLYKLLNSEGWIKNIGDKHIDSVEDAQNYLERFYLSSYSKQGFGPYLVTLKDGTPIGSCGLYKRDSLEYPDIGFAFLSEFANQGYAFEAATAVMQFASETLDLKTVVGITLPKNLPSIKLLKKLGLLEVGTYNFEDGEELLLFSN